MKSLWISNHEKQQLERLQSDWERMLIFGEITIDSLQIHREVAEQMMGDLLTKGKITLIDVTKISKLVQSSDKENIELALKLLESYASTTL